MGGMPDVVTSGIRSSIEAVTVDACAPGSTDTRGVGFAAAAPENFPRAKPAPYFNRTLRRRPHSLHQNVIASAGGHPLAHQSQPAAAEKPHLAGPGSRARMRPHPCFNRALPLFPRKSGMSPFTA